MPQFKLRIAWLIGVVILGASLAAFTTRPNLSATDVAHTSKSSVSGRKWCEPLKVFIPEPGFRPLNSSESQLRANGFPPRPATSNRHALILWNNVVKHAQHFTVPHPVCGTNQHSIIYNGHWAGHLVPKSDYGNNNFTASQSEWVQPSVNSNSGYSNYQDAPDASFWTGMGNTDLIQAGVDSIATATVQYKFWTEDYPENTVWEGPAVKAGDTVFVYVKYLGNNQSSYYLENLTSNAVQSFTNASPDVGESAANFINERLNGLYLPNFGSIVAIDNYFYQGSKQTELTATNNRVDMTSNCNSNGTPLSEPTGVSGGQFDQDWYASSPFSNSC